MSEYLRMLKVLYLYAELVRLDRETFNDMRGTL